MIALGIDPGNTSGIVLIEKVSDWKILETYLIGDGESSDSFAEFALSLEALFDGWIGSGIQPDIICVEDYDNRLIGNNYTAKLVGAIWSLAARYSIPVISKYPSQTKSISNQLLEDLIEVKLKGHERDALRCVIACLS